MEAPKLKVTNNVKSVKNDSGSLLNLWLLLNIIFIIFYGFIHQAGVLKATNYLSHKIRTTSPKIQYHIITSNIYLVPESFLLEKSANNIFNTNETRLESTKRVSLYEEGTKDTQHMIFKTKLIVEIVQKLQIIDNNKKFKIYLLLPTIFNSNLLNYVKNDYIHFKLVRTFYPHLSVEAISELFYFCTDTIQLTKTNDNCIVLPLKDYLYKVFSLFYLNLYEVSYTKAVNNSTYH